MLWTGELLLAAWLLGGLYFLSQLVRLSLGLLLIITPISLMLFAVSPKV
jgi:hypothetical protein